MLRLDKKSHKSTLSNASLTSFVLLNTEYRMSRITGLEVGDMERRQESSLPRQFVAAISETTSAFPVTELRRLTNQMRLLAVLTNERAAYLMTERAVSCTLEKCDSRRLKIILKWPMVCISTPALFLITCAREVRASSPC